MNVLDKQASLTIAGIAAAVTAVLGLLTSFGLHLTPDQTTAILKFVTVAMPIIVLGVGWLIKQYVYSKKAVVVALSKPVGTTVDQLDKDLAKETPAPSAG